ncbi:hypothetical protein SAMN04489834_1084 [Microterricola viridarii]|uniref:Uncharacterized protein n=1 Tax=Microterricola viridarii TaxID=412690 RepID=A0A1H1QG04_9MICO|nr:hypothetical protein SAMN04489834_1084 [Microterricola viridarii]
MTQTAHTTVNDSHVDSAARGASLRPYLVAAPALPAR